MTRCGITSLESWARDRDEATKNRPHPQGITGCAGKEVKSSVCAIAAEKTMLKARFTLLNSI